MYHRLKKESKIRNDIIRYTHCGHKCMYKTKCSFNSLKAIDKSL